MNLGNKMTELRKVNKLSQEELANKLDVSRQSISLWETNQSSPSTEKLIALAKFFNVKVDVLINDEMIDKDNSLIIRTIHSEISYRYLLLETANYFIRHLSKIMPITLILILIIVIGDISLEERLLFVAMFLIIAVPIISIVINYFEHKKAQKNLNFSKKNLQRFIFKDEELVIYFEDGVSTTESKVKYQAFKKAKISNHYLYLEHPSMKRKFFQMDLNDFINGDKGSLLDFLRNKNINVEKVKSRKIAETQNANKKNLFLQKSLFYSLIGSIILTIAIFISMSLILDNASNELNSYYSTRDSMNDIPIFSVLIIPLVVAFFYVMYLSKKNYKSKLIIVSYIIVPIATLGILAMTLVIPGTFNERYSKDYEIAKNIFNIASIYIPDDGLSVSEKTFKFTEDNKTIIPFTEKHKVLLTNNINTFEDSLINNVHWVTSKTILMKAKLNMFIDQEADYYLIYNETANNYNEGELENGINKLYVFYYYFGTNEIIIYEFYLDNNGYN